MSEISSFWPHSSTFAGHFDRLYVDGFRRLKKFDLELRRFAVLIGANGCGKTSVLDVMSLLSASAQGQLAQQISHLGGMPSILTIPQFDPLATISPNSSLESAIEVGVRFVDPAPNASRLSYGLRIVAAGPGYVIERETLHEQAPDGERRSPHNSVTPEASLSLNDQPIESPGSPPRSPYETDLSRVSWKLVRQSVLRYQLALSTHVHALGVGPRDPIRLPQALRPAVLPGANGDDLASCLHQMRESNIDRFEAVEDALRAAFPEFEKLTFPSPAAGMLAIGWKHRNLSRPLYLHQLSEGTLRFLWLTTLLQSPGLPAVTMIDEPEVSLHPELLGLLADLMREASSRTQLIVATHADRLVRFLKPQEIAVMDINDDGSASAKWGDTLDLNEWLKDYTLDEVWQMGVMGGRA